jgi:hypothetical protein
LQTDFLVKTGRQGLYFQYKHISGETTRIDPATSNIIDLYVLTQSYYTQYTNWIQDTTGSIAEPARPTINELTQTYSNINEYKIVLDKLNLVQTDEPDLEKWKAFLNRLKNPKKEVRIGLVGKYVYLCAHAFL